MRRLLCSAVIVPAFIVIALTATGAARDRPAPAVDQAKTEELYRQNCQMCHMPDGDAALEQMNFADGKWIHGSDLKQVVKVIADGVPGTAMMPFKGRLTDEQIEALARYVRTFDKTLKPEQTPAAAANAAGSR